MDLLSKFDAVAAEPDSQITAQDKAFCAAHQAAYDAARASLEKLILIWEEIQAEQQAALDCTGSSPDRYLTSDSLRISVPAIREQIVSLHTKLIHDLVRYFNVTYHISVQAHSIEENLLPPKPDWYSSSSEQKDEYKQQLQNFSLHSGQIVEQIFAQLDGRSLWEQALHELKSNCHRAAWNTHRGESEFILNKNVIRFSYGCSYENCYPIWRLTDEMKIILRGLAHYETGNFDVTPTSFSPLLGYNHIGAEIVPFPDCQKVSKLRMFKNHRVDLTFVNECSARGFVEGYLGLVC